MARVYIDKYSGEPLFSPEKTVGIGMSNAPTDVMLVQYLLKVTLHSNKIYLAGDTRMTPPPGEELVISGNWDETSKRYLKHWEELRYEAKAYWGHGKSDPTQFPGTVVPYIQGGKKIRAMQEMCVTIYSRDAYARCQMPNAQLPIIVWRELFWDPVRGIDGGP